MSNSETNLEKDSNKQPHPLTQVNSFANEDTDTDTDIGENNLNLDVTSRNNSPTNTIPVITEQPENVIPFNNQIPPVNQVPVYPTVNQNPRQSFSIPYPNYYYSQGNMLNQPYLDNNGEEYDKGWTRSNIRVVKYYVNFLSYMSLVYHFYYFKLKQIEGYWSWAIIVFSSLSSALSLFQYHEEKYYLDLTVKITITLFTLIITLISSWIKKQNYVERISELGKYSQKLNRLKNTVKSIIEEPIMTRMDYHNFSKEYKDTIVEFISNRPMISPYEWKETVFIISKYYPELAAYEFPWNKIEGYGSHAMETYNRLKYNALWKKIKHCYYCKSRCCCSESLESKKIAEEIIESNIKFYQNLPKHDLDYNPYHSEKNDDKIKLKSKTSRFQSKYVYSDSEIDEPTSRGNLNSRV